MQNLLFEFVKLRRLPAGRASFALAKMRVLLIAAAVNAPNVQARLTDAQAEAKRTLHMDLRWMHARKQTSRARGDAVAVDREIDETVKAIHKRLEADSVGKETDPVVIAATAIHKELFADGLGAVTRQAYDIQLALVDTLLERLEGDFDAHVQTLGMERLVQNLRSLNEQFRVELDTENGRPLVFTTVDAQRNALHAAICHLIAAIFTDLHEPTPENSALLQTIFTPLKAQAQVMADALQKKLRSRDVNPKTGEELDTDVGTDDHTDEPIPQPAEI